MTDYQPPDYSRINDDEPLPDLPPVTPPAPNAEDRKVAAETGRSPEYIASLRTVRTVADWEAARAAEADRQKPK